jgi:hypothetical protein
MMIMKRFGNDLLSVSIFELLLSLQTMRSDTFLNFSYIFSKL